MLRYWDKTPTNDLFIYIFFCEIKWSLKWEEDQHPRQPLRVLCCDHFPLLYTLREATVLIDAVWPDAPSQAPSLVQKVSLICHSQLYHWGFYTSVCIEKNVEKD